MLNALSISVRDHEVVCLVGRNGSGKTTVAETIMGYLPARAGQIILHGEDITALPPYRRARRGIGYAPDYSGVFTELTVAENLTISELAMAGSAPNRKTSKEHVLSIFPEIQDFLHQPGRNLSGGREKWLRSLEP